MSESKAGAVDVACGRSGHVYGPPPATSSTPSDRARRPDFKYSFAAPSVPVIRLLSRRRVGRRRVSPSTGEYRMDRGEITGSSSIAAVGYRTGADVSKSDGAVLRAAVRASRRRSRSSRTSSPTRSTSRALAQRSLYIHRTLSGGVSLQYFTFSLDATNKVFSARDELYSVPGPQVIEPDNVEGITTQTGMTTGGGNGGSCGRPRAGRRSAAPCAGSPLRVPLHSDGPDGSPPEHNKDENGDPFRYPIRTASMSHTGRLTLWQVSFEYDHVNYHQLIDDFRDTVFGLGNAGTAVVADTCSLGRPTSSRIGSSVCSS